MGEVGTTAFESERATTAKSETDPTQKSRPSNGYGDVPAIALYDALRIERENDRRCDLTYADGIRDALAEGICPRKIWMRNRSGF